MKKYTHIIVGLSLIVTYFLGFFTPRDFFNVKKVFIKNNIYQINVCNNTEIDFEGVNLFAGASYDSIKSGTCSQYIKRKELYRYVPMLISTLENMKTHQYSITYMMEYAGETQLSEGKYTININRLDKGSIPVIKYGNAIDYNIVPMDIEDTNQLGYTYRDGNIQINYPIFIKNINSDLEKKIIEEIKNDNSETDFVLSIKNINDNNFSFLPKLTSQINFERYNFWFDEYNDEYNYIFDNLKNSSNIIEFDIKFNSALKGENTLIKTFNKISELNIDIGGYLTIYSEKDFFDSYKITKEELDILHSIDVYGLYLKLQVENKELLKEVEKIILSTKFGEYSLWGKYSKGAGINGIYKYLENGEQIKIAEDNERL